MVKLCGHKGYVHWRSKEINSNRSGRKSIPEVNRPSNSSEIALRPRTYRLEDFAECPSRDPLYVSAIEYHKVGQITWCKSDPARCNDALIVPHWQLEADLRNRIWGAVNNLRSRICIDAEGYNLQHDNLYLCVETFCVYRNIQPKESYKENDRTIGFLTSGLVRDRPYCRCTEHL